MVAVTKSVREPLQFLLLELGACVEAIRWAKGRCLDEAAWLEAGEEWRKWLAEMLKCPRTFAAVEEAVRSGSGDGYGDGYGYGYGYGDGHGYGSGSGYGYGYGDGHGSGDGYGYGHGDGSGYGSQ